MAVVGDLYCVAQSLGYPSLRPYQHQVIENIMRGRNVFAILPTGYGKSLCYLCLARLFPSGSVVIVVSPLKVLLEDQVRKFMKFYSIYNENLGAQF